MLTRQNLKNFFCFALILFEFIEMKNLIPYYHFLDIQDFFSKYPLHPPTLLRTKNKNILAFYQASPTWRGEFLILFPSKKYFISGMSRPPSLLTGRSPHPTAWPGTVCRPHHASDTESWTDFVRNKIGFY